MLITLAHIIPLASIDVARSCSTSGPVNTWMGDRLWADKTSRYVISHLGQLSLPSLRSRLIEYQPFWLWLGGVAGNTVWSHGEWCPVALSCVQEELYCSTFNTILSTCIYFQPANNWLSYIHIHHCWIIRENDELTATRQPKIKRWKTWNDVSLTAITTPRQMRIVHQKHMYPADC